MNLDDIKDQIKEQFQTLVGEIQENSTFQNIREQYETLPSSTQKAIVIAAGIALALILFSVPYNYFNTASEYVEEFESHRELIRELQSVSKEKKGQVVIGRNISMPQLRDTIIRKIDSFQLLPTQIGKISPTSKLPGSLSKPPITEEAIAVNLNTLNLTQIVDIGFALQDLIVNVKMTGLAIVASTNNNGYFNVVYTLSNYNLPQTEPTSQKGGQRSKRNRK